MTYHLLHDRRRDHCFGLSAASGIGGTVDALETPSRLSVCTHALVYVAFAGVVSIGLGLVGAYLVVDKMVRRFVTKADYFRNPA